MLAHSLQVFRGWLVRKDERVIELAQTHMRVLHYIRQRKDLLNEVIDYESLILLYSEATQHFPLLCITSRK